VPGAKYHTTLGVAYLLPPACGNGAIALGLVRHDNPMKGAELFEMIPRDGSAHDGIGLQPPRHFPHRGSANELPVRLPRGRRPRLDLDVEEFKVRTQRLCSGKGRCEYGFVSVPATGQHEYVFHCVLPLENRRQRRCAAKTVFLRCAYFSLILYDLYIANNLYQRGSEKPEIAVSWIPDSEYKLIWASTCRKSSTAGAALGFRWIISPRVGITRLYRSGPLATLRIRYP
jgi:hypothetical protein